MNRKSSGQDDAGQEPGYMTAYSPILLPTAVAREMEAAEKSKSELAEVRRREAAEEKAEAVRIRREVRELREPSRPDVAATLRQPVPAPLPTGAVPVFTAHAIQAAESIWAGQDRERKDRFDAWIKKARELNGHRVVPQIAPAKLAKRLDRLESQFPNFRQVVDFLRVELALNVSLPPEKFRVPPVLLYGPPGIGKSAFAEVLSTILDSASVRISAANQGAFELTGTAMHWTNAAPGKVFHALAGGKSASPVLLLDELDKMGSSDERFTILPALLALLEPQSARCFEDQAVAIEMDTTKAVVAGTANDPARVPAPVQSRMLVLEIAPPTRAEVRQIAGGIARQLTRDLRRPVSMPGVVLDAIARDAADLREVQRLVRQAVGRALLDGKRKASPVASARAPARRGIGFLGVEP